MNAKPVFYLYGTSACHLCDEAMKVVEDLHDQMLSEFGVPAGEASVLSGARFVFFDIVDVDIAESDLLFETYGTRIPVLLNHDKSLELAWPFDVVTLYQFMSQSV